MVHVVVWEVALVSLPMQHGVAALSFTVGWLPFTCSWLPAAHNAARIFLQSSREFKKF